MQNDQASSRAQDCRCREGKNGQDHSVIGPLPQLPGERVGEVVFVNKAGQALRSLNTGPVHIRETARTGQTRQLSTSVTQRANWPRRLIITVR